MAMTLAMTNIDRFPVLHLKYITSQRQYFQPSYLTSKIGRLSAPSMLYQKNNEESCEITKTPQAVFLVICDPSMNEL
jgi:hypothetical protein